ncbi:ATP-dependent DNA ligase [Candidatus Micrarchaeota archaeon]|nr:ATP-dependent DNA ligase [Candidatus Micrarchaeota archaeon]
MKFSIVVEYLKEIENESSRLVITEILSKLLSLCSKQDIEPLILLLQGQIAPPFKNMPLGLGEKFIIQSIAVSTGHTVKSVENRFNKIGDFGLLAEELSATRKQQALTAKDITIREFYETFVKIADSSGGGSQTRKIRYLAELFNSSSPLEARYIARFAQGDLRIGIGDPTILDALSYINAGDKSMREYIERAYNTRSDLALVAKTLFENPEKLKGFIPTPFYPIRPALAERLPTAKHIFEKLGECYVDGKYDGVRIQAHKKNDKVEIYSRRLENVTYMFPDVVEAIKNLKQKELILEGEAIGYDAEKDKYYSFQFTIQRKRKHDVHKTSKAIPLHVYLFDVLYVDGKSMVDEPYENRRKKLQDIIPENYDILKPSEVVYAKNEKDIQKFFDKCVKKGLEGIIAKDLSKPYIAGARKFAWVKLKKSYSSLVDTIDAVILGYYLGKGKRAEFEFGGILIGTYNDSQGVFETVARVGSGFTEDEMRNFKELLDKIKLKKKPNNIISKIEPDFWVTPKYIVVVAADEITKSPMHTCASALFKLDKGLALRFPRMLNLRETKGPYDATTSEEVYDMYKLNK